MPAFCLHCQHQFSSSSSPLASQSPPPPPLTAAYPPARSGCDGTFQVLNPLPPYCTCHSANPHGPSTKVLPVLETADPTSAVTMTNPLQTLLPSPSNNKELDLSHEKDLLPPAAKLFLGPDSPGATLPTNTTTVHGNTVPTRLKIPPTQPSLATGKEACKELVRQAAKWGETVPVGISKIQVAIQLLHKIQNIFNLTPKEQTLVAKAFHLAPQLVTCQGDYYPAYSLEDMALEGNARTWVDSA